MAAFGLTNISKNTLQIKTFQYMTINETKLPSRTHINGTEKWGSGKCYDILLHTLVKNWI